MAKGFNWNPDNSYNDFNLGSIKEFEVPELDYYAKAKSKSNEGINRSTDLQLDRNASARKAQQGAAGVDAAMSVLGLLSAHGVAKRAKAKVEATYKSNLRAIDLNVKQSTQEIGINEATGRKNIYATMNQAKTSINANLLRDPRALSTANMSELQGAEGRINQSADLDMATSKMGATAAKGELALQTTIAKGKQEVEKWRQKEAIEGQKAAALRKGVMDVAKTGMMFI